MIKKHPQINHVEEKENINGAFLKSLSILKYIILSYDVSSESEITPCNKIDKPLVFYRFSGNVMTSISTLRTK